MFGNDSHEFKPILSEIEDSPVSPMGRFTFWLLVAIIITTITWLTVGEVDVVVTGRGKVVPEGQVKTLQPLDTGVITNILVQEGQTVKKGQVLMEIDTALTEPVLTSSRQNLEYSNLETERVLAMLEERPFQPDYQHNDPSVIQTQMTLYNSGMHGYQSQILVKQQQQSQLDEQISTMEDTQKRTQELFSISEAQYNRLLPVKDLMSKQEFDGAEKELLTLRHQKQEVSYKLAEMQHQVKQLQTEIALIRQTFRNTLLGELSKLEKASFDINARTKEMGFHNGKQQIVSPVNGVVDQLFIHTVGGVVTPAEKLLIVVPSDSKLQIEARIDNRDIGFIHPNMSATLKVDTFDFQKYGTLPGRVEQVSSDSRAVDEQNKEQTVYKVIVNPEKTFLLVEGKPASIRSGMTITTEIKIGKRHIIEFFINPLIKSLDESVKLR